MKWEKEACYWFVCGWLTIGKEDEALDYSAKYDPSPGPTIQEALGETQGEAALRAKNEAAIQLLHEWLDDDSGYDERAWPRLKEAIEEDRLSYRKRFSD